MTCCPDTDPPNILLLFPTPKAKFPTTCVAAEAAATEEVGALFPAWFNADATAVWTTRSIAVPEAEQSAITVLLDQDQAL